MNVITNSTYDSIFVEKNQNSISIFHGDGLVSFYAHYAINSILISKLSKNTSNKIKRHTNIQQAKPSVFHIQRSRVQTRQNQEHIK